MRQRITLGAIVLAAFLVSAAAPAARTNQTKESYAAARKILEASLDAMGGAARLGTVEDVAFKISGTLHARNQSLWPDTPYDILPVDTDVMIDLKRDRVIWQQSTEFPGGIRFMNRVLLKQDGGVSLDLIMKTHTKLPPTAPARVAALRMLPTVMVQKALEQKSTARLQGEATVDGRKCRLVGFNWNNVQYTLYIDAATKLPVKIEFLAPDPWAGDDVGEIHYADYQPIDGMQLPTRLRQARTGKTIRESRYSDFKFNTRPGDDAYQLPEGYPAATSPAPAVKTLAKDVYLMEGLFGGGYRAMFVAFNDHVLVVEAPGNSQVSNQVIAKIKETVPGKPIKYLVLTHYHDDHTGGLRPYIAEGAKIVTTARNRTFFEYTAKADFTLFPDALTKKPAMPDFLFVEKRQTFEDAGHKVEIINIGPTPHVADMYLVSLPNEKLVFQADLYNPPVSLVTQSAVFLVEQIEKLGLNPERIAGVHNETTSFEQVKTEAARIAAKK